MKKNKPRIIVFFVVFILFMGSTGNAVSNVLKVVVDDKALESTAKLIDGKVYVPVDTIAQSLGADVNWNKNSNTVTVKSKNISVSQVIEQVGPSVVGIIGKLTVNSEHYSDYGDNLVFGSGVIYRSNGYILTNAHVVSDMDKIVVVLSNGRSYAATLKAIDEKCDLALIKIDKGGLKAASFGKISDVHVGDQVIAIGTPLSFSLRNSATLGIVSGMNRPVEGEYRYIQSDAAINSGNSGGPLVNTKGQVIGINTIKYTGTGVEGMNFSIPVDTVVYAVNHFEKYGKILRPYLGATFSEGITARYGLPSNEGLTITEITNNEPADKAGMLVDDVVTAINGVKLTSLIDYTEETKKFLPGSIVEFSIEREDKVLKLKVTFDEKQ